MTKYNYIEVQTKITVPDSILHELSDSLYVTLSAAGCNTYLDDILDFDSRHPNKSVVIIGLDNPITINTFKKLRPIIRSVFKEWNLGASCITPAILQ